MIKNDSFIGQTTPSKIDIEYRNCTFSQPAPIDDNGDKKGVRIFPGDDTPRTFFECNLVNCEPPPGSTLTNCNTTIRDSNLLVNTDTVTIDGQSTNVEERVDRIYGRFNPTTFEYDYKPSPIDIPIEEIIE